MTREGVDAILLETLVTTNSWHILVQLWLSRQRSSVSGELALARDRRIFPESGNVTVLMLCQGKKLFKERTRVLAEPGRLVLAFGLGYRLGSDGHA